MSIRHFFETPSPICHSILIPRTGVLIEKFNGMFWQARRLWFSCSLDRLVWGENDTASNHASSFDSHSKLKSSDGVNGEAHGFELSSTLAAVSRGMETQ
jgi:hypothetical protein